MKINNNELVLATANTCFFARCEVAMGDLQSEEERDILLEMKLPAVAADTSAVVILQAKLVYFNVITSNMTSVDCNLSIERNSEYST